MAKTIVGKILAAFKSLFPSFIEKTYKKIEPELRQEISWITKIVSHINEGLQNPLVDIITMAIPGTKDDDFVKWARIVVPKLIASLQGTGKLQLSNEDKAIASAKLVVDRTDMELSQALITSQVVYKKENS